MKNACDIKSLKRIPCALLQNLVCVCRFSTVQRPFSVNPDVSPFRCSRVFSLRNTADLLQL